ncbi:MAG: glycosyltransferase family 2 protein [Terriglobia bacterium]
MGQTKPSLSVVIVSWNTKRLVLECLESLERSRGCLPLELILVDNASSDGTAEDVQRQFPHVRLVRNERNLGFARANNIGINLSSGEYVCLVNSDVAVPDGCLQKMLDYMEEHADVGMLGPKMILPDGSVGQSCMQLPTVWKCFCNALALDSLCRGSKIFGDLMMRGFTYDRIEDVEVLTGWFWLIRREAMNQVGLLDDRFFMYGEDIDWPKRFHDSGWRVVFHPGAEAIHHCAASSSKAPIRFYVEMHRANMQYYEKHHRFHAVFGFWLATCLQQIIRIVGYGFLYLVKQSVRSKAGYRVRRSLACLLWLTGLRTQREAQ